MKKGSISGITMVLACYVLFNYSISYKHLSECLCGILPSVSRERVVVTDFIRDSSPSSSEAERPLVNPLCFHLKELEGPIRVQYVGYCLNEKIVMRTQENHNEARVKRILRSIL